MVALEPVLFIRQLGPRWSWNRSSKSLYHDDHDLVAFRADHVLMLLGGGGLFFGGVLFSWVLFCMLGGSRAVCRKWAYFLGCPVVSNCGCFFCISDSWFLFRCFESPSCVALDSLRFVAFNLGIFWFWVAGSFGGLFVLYRPMIALISFQWLSLQKRSSMNFLLATTERNAFLPS